MDSLSVKDLFGRIVYINPQPGSFCGANYPLNCRIKAFILPVKAWISRSFLFYYRGFSGRYSEFRLPYSY